ncbi:MAG TPA: pectinesterase family protein [Limnochordia bacterium]|nr:pectinesterase family protein [Limnochordia bacterium]
MIVAQDGSGDFKTIQEAINQVPEDNQVRTVIDVKAGEYYEKLHIDKKMVTLKGEPGKTTITYDDCAVKRWPNGEKYGTFHSYSVLITGDDFTAEGITFENSAGPGAVAGQALAAYIDADRVIFRNCRFLGHQDTIFTAPLPPKPGSGDRFNSPRDDYERRMGRHYFENCFIAGDVDFIFGSATAVFYNCEIFSHDRHGGYVTAASTPEGEKYGYVFIDCRLTGDAPADSVYLGRPWREFAKTVFINTYMGEHIRAEGWHNWGSEAKEKTTFYAEYNSSGPGAKIDQRVKWAKVLTSQEAEEYTVENVLRGKDGWNQLAVK